jgi:hypothetical protein
VRDKKHGQAARPDKNGTYPLVAGVYSTRNKAMLAFEATEDTIVDKTIRGLDKPIAPNIVSGPAPCQEVLLTGKDIDITRFPIPTYSPKDGRLSPRASSYRRIRKPAFPMSGITASRSWARTQCPSWHTPIIALANISQNTGGCRRLRKPRW